MGIGTTNRGRIVYKTIGALNIRIQQSLVTYNNRDTYTITEADGTARNNYNYTDQQILVAQNNGSIEYNPIKIETSPQIIEQILENPDPENIEAIMKTHNLTYGEVILMLECRNKPEKDVNGLREKYRERINNFKNYYKKFSKYSQQDKRNFIMQVHKKMVARNKEFTIDDEGSLFDTVSIYKIKDIEPYFKAAVIASWLYIDQKSEYWEGKQLNDWIVENCTDCNLYSAIMIDLGNTIDLFFTPVILNEHTLIFIPETNNFIDSNTGIFQNKTHYEQIKTENTQTYYKQQLDILCTSLEENIAFNYYPYINPNNNNYEQLHYGISGIKKLSNISLKINPSAPISMQYAIYIAYIENDLASLENIINRCPLKSSIKYAYSKIDRNHDYFDIIAVKSEKDYDNENYNTLLANQQKKSDIFMSKFREFLKKNDIDINH